MRHKLLTRAVLTSCVLLTPIVYADVTVIGNNVCNTGACPPPLSTSVVGNVEIMVAGSLTSALANTDGIIVDSDAASIITDPAGVATVAINITGANGNGINIIGGGTNADINNGTNRSIFGDEAGIKIQGDEAFISNSGTISGSTYALEIGLGGTNASVENNATGTIFTLAEPTPTIIVGDSGFELQNAGTVSYSNGAALFTTPTIQVNAADATINNTTMTAVIRRFFTVGTPSGFAIELNSLNTEINNAGTIDGAAGAINLTAASQDTIINNLTGGVIGVNGAPVNTNANTILVDGTGLELTNSGTIENTVNSGSTIALLKNFDSIVNNATGIIRTTDVAGIASTILINAVSGDIDNFGIISNASKAPAININGAYTGTITNFTGGSIVSTNAAGFAIFISNAPNGTIINDGGSISATNATGVIVAGLGGALADLINDGTITQNGAGPAIDLKSGGLIDFTQQGGTVTGDVFLAGGGGPTAFTMTGGTINGDVTSSSTNASTLTLQGGVITGTTLLGNVDGNIVNLSGSTLQLLQGGTQSDTFNVTGGSFTALDGGGDPDTLNVNASFTTTGPISNIETINVNNAGTVFTIDDNITDVIFAFNINAGASAVFNTNIPNLGGGTITNNGLLRVNDNFTVTNTGQTVNNGNIFLTPLATFQDNFFTQNAGGNYTVSIQNPFNGLIEIFGGNAVLAPGSTITVNYIPGAFLLEGTTFDILRAPIGNIADSSTLVQPASVTVFFTKSGPAGVICNGGLNSCIQLTSGRNPFEIVGISDVARAVGATLDGLIPLFPGINPDLLAVIEQIDSLGSIQAVNDALEQLAPSFSFGMIVASRASMRNAFDSAQHRLEDLRGVGPLMNYADAKLCRDDDFYNGLNCYKELGEGYAYGDIADIDGGAGTFSAWFKVYGDYFKQKTMYGYPNTFPGFQGDDTGLAVGGDWRINDCAALGVAISGTNASVHDVTPQRNTASVDSGQVTFYGWFEPLESVYIDSMIGLAGHKYDTTRNVGIGTFAATAVATFYGLEYGAQIDVGYAFLTPENYYVVPFARYRYSYLNMDSYAETGAGGINLVVDNGSLSEQIAGVGLRLAKRMDYVEAIYVPEIYGMMLYDFAEQPQDLVSTFLGGGNPFYIKSYEQDPLIFLVGFSVNAHTSDGYTFTFKINGEFREGFWGVNAYGQLRYTWG